MYRTFITMDVFVCRFILIIFEIVGCGTLEVRWVMWRFDLGNICALVTLVLPGYLFYSVLRRRGCKRRSSVVGGALLLLPYLACFWRIGAYLPTAPPPPPASDPATLALNYHGGMAWLRLLPISPVIRRIGVLGVAAISVLSGFGAVYNPYTKLPQFLHPTSAAQVRESEQHPPQ